MVIFSPNNPTMEKSGTYMVATPQVENMGQKADTALTQGKWLRRPERFREKVASEWVLNLFRGAPVLSAFQKEKPSPATQEWGPKAGAMPTRAVCWEPEAPRRPRSPEDPEGPTGLCSVTSLQGGQHT